MAGEGGGLSFESTPSWIIGAVVLVIVSISLLVDKLLHQVGEVLKKKDKIPLYEALQKVKEELMLMGFVSLLLALVQSTVQKKCIPKSVIQHWLPCYGGDSANIVSATTSANFTQAHRILAEGEDFTCPEGKVPFVSEDVLHRLHYLIFILAIVHIATCTLTVLLGKIKINQWSKWEESIGTPIDENNGEQVNDPHSLPFFKGRCLNADMLNYVISFFKHLCGIVTKADYEALRMGFVVAHFNGDPRFQFHKYMTYAYEADFMEVVSIRWFLWLLAVISLTFNVAGWHIYTWISIVPLFLLLVVGTKLEQVITDIAQYVAQRNTVIVGDARIQVSDEYFWFDKPKLMLKTIHIILFLNSFGLAVFIWTWNQFEFDSCLMGTTYRYPRMIILVAVQAICSYSTLPLYAIVTQMGSTFNQKAMMRYTSVLINTQT